MQTLHTEDLFSFILPAPYRVRLFYRKKDEQLRLLVVVQLLSSYALLVSISNPFDAGDEARVVLRSVVCKPNSQSGAPDLKEGVLIMDKQQNRSKT